MTDERTKGLLGWLGKIVTVMVDKPIGAPRSETNTTPLPYYMGRLTSAGKNPPPVCLFQVTNPGSSYTGRVISVLRQNGAGEDLIIVAPAWQEMYEPWIRAMLAKVEDVSMARLFCLYEKSCGVIPYRMREGRLEYLALFQSDSATWSFPKGHMEYGEDELATARREVQEEIGVDMEITTDFRCEIFYMVHNKRSRKKVVLFAVPFDGPVRLREGEIGDAKWLPRHDVQKLFGHKELRGIFNRLEKKYEEDHGEV